MVTVLVTGHTGFLGKNLIPALERIGEKVIPFSKSGGGNILDPKGVLDATKKVDTVYHFAAYAKPAESLRYPSEALDLNIRGTFNVLEAARRNGFILVYPSTCEIYGDSVTAIDEDCPINPPNPYAASKAAADRLCYSYTKAYGLRIVILRLFNPYGQHQQLNKVIPTFYSQAAKGEPITVFGPGQDTRDYTHVWDVVRAMIMAREYSSGLAVNICTGRATTNLEVALMIKKLMSSASEVRHVGYPAMFGGIKNQVGSNSRAKQVLKWEPAIDFETGLVNTLNWLNSLYGRAKSIKGNVSTANTDNLKLESLPDFSF